jgi:hypothetical protein
MRPARLLAVLLFLLLIPAMAVAQARAVPRAAAVPAQAQGPCTLNTIAGTYALEMKGQAFQGGISAVPGPLGVPMLEGTVFPIYMTGPFTVRRDGTAEGTYSGLFGLAPLGVPDPLPMTGTFTVHSDCTGEMEAPNGFGGINVDKFVILDNGREIRTVGISGAPFAWQFTMVRIGRGDESAPMCNPNTARGRYVMRCEGFEATSPGPPPTFAGVLPLFVFDVAADGTMTGRHFSRDHPVEGFAVSGQWTVNPDCTTQTTMQTDALPGVTILARGVSYDNGKEAFGGPVLALVGGQPLPGAFAGFGCHTTRLTR